MIPSKILHLVVGACARPKQTITNYAKGAIIEKFLVASGWISL